MLIGYVRVSTVDQRHDRQDLGADVERLFEEKASAKDRDRPVLRELLAFAREGDTVRVHSMDRLARSLQDLIGLIHELSDNGVTVEFVKEQLTFRPRVEDPYAEFQLHVLGAVGQLERSLIKERQREGIAKAKQRGVYRGRKPALTAEQVAGAAERRALGVPLARIARDLGVSRSTLCTALAGRGVYAGVP